MGSKLGLINVSPVAALSKARETLCGDMGQHKLQEPMWEQRGTQRATCTQWPGTDALPAALS